MVGFVEDPEGTERGTAAKATAQDNTAEPPQDELGAVSRKQVFQLASVTVNVEGKRDDAEDGQGVKSSEDKLETVKDDVPEQEAELDETGVVNTNEKDGDKNKEGEGEDGQGEEADEVSELPDKDTAVLKRS
jgi:hypothetical protein